MLDEHERIRLHIKKQSSVWLKRDRILCVHIELICDMTTDIAVELSLSKTDCHILRSHNIVIHRITADQNTELALKWLELAADAGSVSALEELGDLWSAGSQPEENYSKAINYLVDATKKGSDRAMYLLGRTYSKPTSFQDLAFARSCYESAAYADDMDAIRALADMYSKGIGGEKDSRKAAELRTKILAEDGSRIAGTAVSKSQQFYEQVVAKGNEGVDAVLDKVNDLINHLNQEKEELSK